MGRCAIIYHGRHGRRCRVRLTGWQRRNRTAEREKVGEARDAAAFRGAREGQSVFHSRRNWIQSREEVRQPLRGGTRATLPIEHRSGNPAGESIPHAAIYRIAISKIDCECLRFRVAGSCSNDSFRVSARTRSSLSLSLVSANRRTENCETFFFVFFRRRELNVSSLSLVGKNSLENTLIFIREYMLYIQFVRIEIMLWLIFVSELIQQISYINYVASFLQITPANPIMGRKISIDRSQTRFPFRVNKSPRCNFGTEKRISRISNSISIGTMHRERGGD